MPPEQTAAQFHCLLKQVGVSGDGDVDGASAFGQLFGETLTEGSGSSQGICVCQKIFGSDFGTKLLTERFEEAIGDVWDLTAAIAMEGHDVLGAIRPTEVVEIRDIRTNREYWAIAEFGGGQGSEE